MVDQERMKEYISMGFDKDDAYKMCIQEDKDAQKAAAKEAKQTEIEKDPEENNEQEFNKDEFKAELMESINASIKEQVTGAFKENKLDEIIKGADNNVPEKTTTEKLTENVKAYYGYK